MNKNLITTTLIALLIGSAAGYWMAAEDTEETDSKQSASSERKPLFYRHPMNPEISSPVPAKGEMGMDYIPVYAEENAGSEALTGTVKIDPTIVQDMGVRTTVAKRTTLSRNIRTVGRVTYDEQRVARLHPKYDGWVEKLFVNRTGDRVRKNDMLLSIYSPQLVTSQEEYLLALNNAEILKSSPFEDVRNGAASLLQSSEQRLKLLDMPEHQIRNLKSKREITKGVHIHSPFDGIVMNIGVREGQRLTPETELYMIADLSRVWVIVDIYEDDMPWVRVGDKAKVKVSGIPGRTFTGNVTQIYPYLEAKTRTIKVRMEFDNADLALKPEMFANVEVLTNRQVDAVTIPAEAIVRTGTQEQVFVQRSPGMFDPRKVTVGVSANGQIQIVEGLEEGDIVVTSSQFLIDSESKLKEATAKMINAAQPSPDDSSDMMSEHKMQPEMSIQHDNMDMSGQHNHMDMTGQGDMHDGHDMSDMQDMSDMHDMHRNHDMSGDMGSVSEHESMDMPMQHDHDSMDMGSME
ncbi:MAG: efflux RND transporter periplasmic adaptor subunit [Gallionella sp.]